MPTVARQARQSLDPPGRALLGDLFFRVPSHQEITLANRHRSSESWLRAMIYRPFVALLVARSIHRRVNIYADRLATTVNDKWKRTGLRGGVGSLCPARSGP